MKNAQETTTKESQEEKSSREQADQVAVVQPPGATWSEEEQQLAQEYNVEPKTVRLVGQVIQRRLESRAMKAKNQLCEKYDLPMDTVERIAFMCAESLDDLCKQERENIDIDAEEAPAAASECEVTTGIKRLDDMLWQASYPEQASRYACMMLAKKDKQLGEKIEALLRVELQPFFKSVYPKTDSTGSPLDIECDVMPTVKWLTLLDGFEAARATDSPIDQESETAQENIEAALQFLDVHLSRSTQEDKVAYFVFFDLASKPGVVADRIRDILYEYAKPYIGTIGWEEEACRHDDPETILNMHRMLSLWRQLSGQNA
ncbi:MAG: hypothetical protein CEE38_08485 [Planctomycetes bacterium B3_Pla]|nr:MAG: hypothetical protein CEE38_08485 [Planctomycetes bacterium B3_Pla]